MFQRPRVTNVNEPCNDCPAFLHLPIDEIAFYFFFFAAISTLNDYIFLSFLLFFFVLLVSTDFLLSITSLTSFHPSILPSGGYRCPR